LKWNLYLILYLTIQGKRQGSRCLISALKKPSVTHRAKIKVMTSVPEHRSLQ